MKEFMKHVTVAEYPIFRQQAIERCKWSRTQYNDRYIGRVRLSALEEDIIRQIIAELHHSK